MIENLTGGGLDNKGGGRNLRKKIQPNPFGAKIWGLKTPKGRTKKRGRNGEEGSDVTKKRADRCQSKEGEGATRQDIWS